MNFFEKLLEDKCKEEDTYDFVTQWGYDKKIYQLILSGVSNSYPNYTDHGVTHSKGILNNVLRLFGEEALKTLSSFDVWLLLEGSYLHDCGMYIPIELVEKIIKDENFINYFKNILSDKANPLYDYAKLFKIENEKIEYIESGYIPQKEFAMKFIISSFKRNRHNIDFREVVQNDIKILPSRIYGVLNTVSESHCYSFENVLKLPKKESGLGNEMGHPIFISCLLRLGDLLDIDNNRARHLVLDDLKNDIPFDSKYHLGKHRAITHYWVDTEKVEITATVEGKDSYNIAEITGFWFDQIEEEFNLQIYNWKDIRPANFKEFLPKLGELIIEMKDYENIDSKSKPKFSVDTNSILELLVGENIYVEKENAIRELLQNSMDATYLRIYEDIKDKLRDSQEFKEEYFKNRDIEVNLDNEGDSIWRITIKDKGIGISRDKLKYILNSGSSSKDLEKQCKISKMPLWLQPSGNFGIGFQSVFMLTETVNLKSKSLYTNESIDVEMLKPVTDSRKGGDVYLRKTKFNYEQKIGTEITFLYKAQKINEEDKGRINKRGHYVENKKRYDFLMKEKDYEEIENIKNKIIDVNKYSFVKINLKINGIDISLKKETYLKNKDSYNKKYQIFDLEERERFHLDSLEGIVDLYYKNQFIDRIVLENYIYSLKVNIFGDVAKDVVSIDRNSIKESYLNKNENEIKKEIIKYFVEEVINCDKFDKFLLGLFYFINKKDFLLELDGKKLEKLKEHEEYLFNSNSNLLSGESLNSIKDMIIKDGLKQNKMICVRGGMRMSKLNSENTNCSTNLFFPFKIFKLENFKLNVKYECKIIDKEKFDNGDTNFGRAYYTELKEQYCEEILEVTKADEETLDIKLMNKKRNNHYGEEDDEYERFITLNSFNLKKLRINLEEEEKKKIYFINLFETVNYDREIVEYFRDNYILFPLFYNFKTKKGVWNYEIRERYIEYVYKNQYLKEQYTKNEISEEVDNFIKKLTKEFEIKIISEEELMENNN